MVKTLLAAALLALCVSVTMSSRGYHGREHSEEEGHVDGRIVLAKRARDFGHHGHGSSEEAAVLKEEAKAGFKSDKKIRIIEVHESKSGHKGHETDEKKLRLNRGPVESLPRVPLYRDGY